MVIKKLYVIRDKQKIMAHLESFGWDFARYGQVRLKIGQEEIRCRYTAYGIQKNFPVVELVLSDSRYESVEQVENLFSESNGVVHMIR